MSILLELAAISHFNVADDFAENSNGTGVDVPLDVSIFTDGQITFGVHFAFDTTINDEIVGELEGSFDLYVAGKDIFVCTHCW